MLNEVLYGFSQAFRTNAGVLPGMLISGYLSQHATLYSLDTSIFRFSLDDSVSIQTMWRRT
jgi:hypothetical protein